MPLEAVIVVIDNSDWMRNGDFSPNRFQAQLDAVNMICGHKTNSNVENTVGVISMGGNSCEVLAALTSDLGKVLSELHRVKVNGQPHFSDAIQVAQLALKHRQNKRQEQKIIVFVGSPVEESEADLKRLGTRLKKNKVSVDLINFGEETTNTTKLEAFIQSVNSGDNSHLLTVPAGPHILADILVSSPIIGGEGVPGMDGGVDPSVDPELALALRLSLEESQRAAGAVPPPAAEPAAAAPTNAPAQPSADDAMDIDVGVEEEEEEGEEGEEEQEDEEAALARAIAMSMGGAPVGSHDVPMTEDEELEMALRMSLQTRAEEDKAEKDKNAGAASAGSASQQASGSAASSQPSAADLAAMAEDPAAMEAVLSNLPGVDPNDPSIKSLLDSLKKKDDKK